MAEQVFVVCLRSVVVGVLVFLAAAEAVFEQATAFEVVVACFDPLSTS